MGLYSLLLGDRLYGSAQRPSYTCLPHSGLVQAANPVRFQRAASETEEWRVNGRRLQKAQWPSSHADGRSQFAQRVDYIVTHVSL
jgi:hypothetical protein